MAIIERVDQRPDNPDTMVTMDAVAEAPKITPKEHQIKFLAEGQLENMADWAEWQTRAKLGIYPSDHPVARYAQQAFRNLGMTVDEDNPRVTVYKGQPNAFIFPTGSVYISDQLLKMVDSDEEVSFVLAHEKKHFTGQHSRESIERAEDIELSFKEIIIGGIGLARVHEWEADIEGFIDLDRMGINPLGGITLIEKFRADPKMAKADPEHGKATDRVLNLRAMTHLRDLPSLQNPLHLVPPEIKEAIEKEEFERNIISKFDELGRQLEGHSYYKALDIIDELSLDQALAGLRAYGHLYGREKNGKPKDAFLTAFQRDVTLELSKRVWEQLAETAMIDGKPVTKEQATLLYHAVLNLGLGIDTVQNAASLLGEQSGIMVKDPETGADIPWNEKNFNLDEQVGTLEDVNVILQIFDPEVYTQLRVKLKSNPDKLIGKLGQDLMDNMVFEGDEFEVDDFLQFAENLTKTVAILYHQHGAVTINADSIYRQVVDVASFNLDKNDKAILLEKAGQVKPAVFEVKEPEQNNEAADSSTEKEYDENELVGLFAKLASEHDNYRKDRGEKSDPFSVQQTRRFRRSFGGGVEEEAFEPKQGREFYVNKIREIFKNQQVETPEGLLTFLANFRATLQKDQKLWGQHLNSDDIWNPLIEQVISENPEFGNFQNSLEATLFDLKLRLLIGHDFASNNLIDPRAVFNESMADADINIEWFRQFYNLAKNEEALGKELGVDVKTATINPAFDEEWTLLFKLGKYTLLQKALQTSREEFSETLGIVTNEFPFNHSGRDTGEFTTRTPGEKMILPGDVRRRLLNDIFSTIEFDFSNLQDMKDLYYLSTYIEDRSLAVKLQSVAWEHLSKSYSFDEGFGFLVKELQAGRLLSLQSVNDFIEYGATTHEEIELASQRLLAMLREEHTLEQVAKLIGEEKFMEELLSQHKEELLMACVGNGEDDSQLKTFIYQKWVHFMNVSREIADDAHPEIFINRLYRLDPQSKYILIRDMLTGKDGVLTDKDPSKKIAFIKFFLDNYVEANDPEEGKLLSAMKEIIEEVVKTANYDLLYFAIAPILQERILIPPSKQTPWINIIRNEEAPDGYQDWDYQSATGIKRVDQNDIPALLGFVTGKTEDDVEATQELRNYEESIDNLIGEKQTRVERQRMTVNEFILETAQKLGAPGVRFLQLIGQYVDLPPHLEQAFNQVYDKVGGQSKVTADQTLLREWPEARDRLIGLRRRLGGGSLMSVFSTETSEGNELAMKILNPNAQHHTETSFQLLNEVFTTLSQRNSAFAPAPTLLEDIRDWINGDIDFTGFLEADKRFKGKHEGFSAGGRYRIKVPQSYAPENKYFALEELIEGTNMTELDALQEQGHDTRQIVSLLVKDFFEQVKDGLVHSDIHPGNIRITPNNEVAYLDRNYYLSFSIGDRLFLRNLSGSLGNIGRAVGMSIDYIQSQGTPVDREKRQRILDQAESFNQIADPTDRLMRLAVVLRKEGLRFPVKTTLLVKDIFYLDRMAKKVGYTGIQEALQAK